MAKIGSPTETHGKIRLIIQNEAQMIIFSKFK